MQIVDLQIHLWENARMSPQHRQIPTYNVDDALKEMAEAGVDAAVIHPPSTLGEAANVQAVEAVKAHPEKFCILGNFDLQSPDREEIVRNWRQRPGMLGFRFTFNQPHQQSWWSDGSLDWFWAACEREKLPVGLLAGGHMADLGRIAERHPGLKLHIDHHGRGGGGRLRNRRCRLCQSGRDAGARQISQCRGQALGRAELFERALPLPQHPQIHPPDLSTRSAPQRCFWGTDITRMPCSYRQCVTMFTEELPWLQGRDKELVMGEAIFDWLGWKRPA